MNDKERRSKIFPGKGGQEPQVEVDLSKVATEAVTENNGTIYRAKPKRYKGKHEKK